ncbi:TonB-dependent receptor [Lutibacter sp. A64]|uniref:SusC/RagA family TonB-linked outer membrane protein n=1 Tax=Lutibacter sp. A64 TaxID=2918526 RepID=UPI001F0710B6|nr:TonB-dependent receptor [Lutibacter sp. A64]UMB52574.1 TonB-dependent receptor [Lutibacter sp. A64]
MKLMRTFTSLILSIFLLVGGTIFAQQKQITGTVTSSGEPMPGVSILVKGTSTGVSTDFDGNYTISANNTDTLIFSYIGFLPQEIVVANTSTIDVDLIASTEQLDEVVLIGYGSVKKKDLTSAISTVKGEELSKRVVSNIQDALAGQLPGVQVSSSGGKPGASSSITIRGISTLGDNTPLYVVDDVPLDDINFLSPQDIESVQVLKDASASAIFGSRASNGVIIIRTKQAKTNKVIVSFDAYTGIQSVAKDPSLANATEYAKILNAASLNDGGSLIYSDPESLGNGTNWWNEITQNTPIYNANLSIAKATEDIKISSSISYQDQEGIIKGSDFNRVTARLNTEYKLNDKVTIGENFTFANSKTKNGPDLVWNAHRLEPVTNPYLADYEIDGLNEYSIFSPTITDVPNALGQLARSYNDTEYSRAVGNFYVNWEAIEGLTFKSQFSVYYSSWENNWFSPNYYIEENDKLEVNSVGRTHNNKLNTTWNNTVNYQKEIDDHSINLLGGVILESQTEKTLSGTGENIPSNHEDLRYLDAATEGFFTTGNNEKYSLISYIGRGNYSYKSKYLLTATVRADGSSLFPDGNKWGVFPSVSAAWVTSDEDFMQNVSWISSLKTRVGWGQIGNDNRNSIPINARLTTIGNEYYTLGDDQQVILGTAPANVGNPSIEWETVEDMNFGIDLGLFNSSLNINFDIYKRTTHDMLMAKSIPAYLGSGYDAQWANIGSFETKGVDLGITYKKQINKLKTAFTLNLSSYDATVVELADGEAIWNGNHQRLNSLTYTAEGQTPGLFYGFVTDGIFQNETEINSHSDNAGNIIQPYAQPGDFRFKDLNGDGTLDDDDRQVIGDPTPDFSFGFNMQFNYNNFDLNILFTGKYGNDMLNALNPYLMSGSGTYNSYAGLLDKAWSGEGSTNSQPRLSNDDPNQNFRYSDYYIEDGSFIRLTNLQLGYNLDDSIIESLGLTRARVYMSGENLFTATSFSGLDPDISGSATQSGIDWGHYPLPRTINVGVNLSF